MTNKTPHEFAVMLVNLYNGNKEGAKVEVFNACRAVAGKKGDQPNEYWNNVYKAIDDIAVTFKVEVRDGTGKFIREETLEAKDFNEAEKIAEAKFICFSLRRA